MPALSLTWMVDYLSVSSKLFCLNSRLIIQYNYYYFWVTDEFSFLWDSNDN